MGDMGTPAEVLRSRQALKDEAYKLVLRSMIGKDALDSVSKEEQGARANGSVLVLDLLKSHGGYAEAQCMEHRRHAPGMQQPSQRTLPAAFPAPAVPVPDAACVSLPAMHTTAIRPSLHPPSHAPPPIPHTPAAHPHPLLAVMRGGRRCCQRCAWS